MHFKYLLSLGSNIEPKRDHLNHALEELELYGEVKKKSSIYKTEPWGKKNQSDFYNAVIEFNSHFSPKEFLAIIRQIETKMGRVKSPRWTQRIIDIDILFANDLVIDDMDLIIPHKYLTERKFVLTPLAELTEDVHLPYFLKTAEDILHECTDTSVVEKLPYTWD
jgi:2-amino-4-hydroxy-6-hydroxymethyldihydropteridine diphosphokinase